jgi:UDPglucose--hexose-1-phosphate uridylyltransferase
MKNLTENFVLDMKRKIADSLDLHRPAKEQIMDLPFIKRIITSEFESPFEDFKPVKVAGEVRECPLSGHVTRILPIRLKQFAPLDWAPVVARSKELGCPFCPEALESRTPRFPKFYGLEKGRIRVGGATVFPNAFPYDEHCAVVVFTKEHYLSPGQFTPDMLKEALTACRLYGQRATAVVPEAKQVIINWNYMPLAGAGIVHPHLQAAVLPEFTAYYRAILERQKQYASSGPRSIFDDLAVREMAQGHRHIASYDKWRWIAAFAPRGIYEFWGIWAEPKGGLNMSDSDLDGLVRGICGVLKFLESKGAPAFNLSWYFVFNPPVAGLRNWVSIVPRVNFPVLSTSDVNYFDRLHGESITFVSPEDLTLEARAFLEGRDP